MSAATTYRRLKDPEATKPKRVAVSTPCTRCGGSGIFSRFGTCFRCGGNGIDPTPDKVWAFPKAWTDEECAAFDDARLERNAKATERREAKRLAERDAVWNANLARCPLLAAEDVEGWAVDIVDKAHRFELTDKQIAAFEKAVDRSRQAEVERQQRVERQQQAGHFGELGERIEVEAQVVFVKEVEGQYGTSYLVKMTTADGAVLKTFSSGEFGYEASLDYHRTRWNKEPGTTYRIKGTVAEHGEYNHVPETLLKRVKFIKEA